MFLRKNPEYYDTADTNVALIQSGGYLRRKKNGFIVYLKRLQNEQVKDWFYHPLAGILQQRTVY